jgi:hypothetical protein
MGLGVLVEIPLVVVAILEGESAVVSHTFLELSFENGLVCSIVHLPLSVRPTQFIALPIIPSSSASPSSNRILLCGKGLAIIVGLQLRLALSHDRNK